MSTHNVIEEINKNTAVGDTTAVDFGTRSVKADAITESTSGSGLTLGGIRTAAISVPAGAAYTVLAANSGKVHLIANQAADCTLTLPTAAAGLFYEFWSTMIAADGHDWVFDTGADANFYLGGVMWTVAAGNGTIVVGDGDSNSILGVRLPDAGTLIKMYCDGTNWFLNGHVFSATTPDFADQ